MVVATSGVKADYRVATRVHTIVIRVYSPRHRLRRLHWTDLNTIR